ncbi:polysaccharide biosynthesis tyrosine autokinase [Thermostilla marina]
MKSKQKPLSTGKLPMQAAMRPLARRNGVVAAPGLRELPGHPTPNDVLFALRRRWPWILALGTLAALVVGYLTWKLTPTEYTATAWLRMSLQRPNILFETENEDPLLAHRQTQTKLITSELVLADALRQPGVAQLPMIREKGDPVRWLGTQIHVRFSGEIMEISLTGEDPQQLPVIVNAVKDAYMAKVASADDRTALERLEQLRRKHAEILKQIDNQSREYERLANAVGSADSEIARKKAITALETLADHRARVNELRRKISGLDQKITLLKKRIDYLKQQRPNISEEERKRRDAAVIEQIVEEGLAKDPWMVQAVAQKATLESRLFEEKQRVRNPELSLTVRRMEEQLASLEAAIKQREAELRPRLEDFAREQIDTGSTETPPTTIEKIESSIADAELEKAVLEDELKVAMEQFLQAAHEAESMGKSTAELEAARAERERLKSIAAKLGDEIQRLEVERDAPLRVQEMIPATRPRESNIDKKYRFALFMGLAAFVGVAGLFIGYDFLTRPVSSTHQLAYDLGIHVVGSLPLVHKRRLLPNPAYNGSVPDDIRAVLHESVDNIRTTLIHRAKKDGLKVVMVTSGVAREGKSTVASQLAASLARAGRKTILVDGDLRRPRIHRVLKQDLAPGLSEYLRGEATLEEIVRETDRENLWLIPAGRCDSEALQAIARSDPERLFQVLRREFDFVVVDTSPLLTAADSLAVGRFMDGVLLSVIRDNSRLPLLLEAYQRLEEVELPLLGVVLNGGPAGRYRSYYRAYTIDVESREPKTASKQPVGK